MSGTSRPRSAKVFSIPGRPEEVVGVVVGQEDVLDVGQPDAAQQLALGALAAVDQDALAAAAHEQAGGRALDGRHRPGGAEEEDGEVHAAYLRGLGRAIIARAMAAERKRAARDAGVVRTWPFACEGRMPRDKVRDRL